MVIPTCCILAAHRLLFLSSLAITSDFSESSVAFCAPVDVRGRDDREVVHHWMSVHQPLVLLSQLMASESIVF